MTTRERFAKVVGALREAGLIVVEKAPPARAPTRDLTRVEAPPTAPPRAPAPSVLTMAASLPR